MIRLRMFVAVLFLVAFSLVADNRELSADEYVWARTNWGNGGGVNRPVSAMSNGYGGYYVPKNAYGNNHEGQRVTNPTGYIVPSPQGQPSRWTKWAHWMHRY